MLDSKGRQQKNPNRTFETIAAKWLCRSKVTGEVQEVAETILLETITPSYLEVAKRLSAGGRRKFVTVGPGDAKFHSEFPKELEKGSEINYKQSEDERICLVASFASFLHAIDCQQHGALLFSNKHKIQEQIDVFFKFREHLDSMSTLLHLEKYEGDRKLMESLVFPDVPIVTCVVDSKGQDDHSITIYKNWIYDSNFTHALPLCKEALDHCCSSDDLKLSFGSMTNTYYIPTFD